MLFMSAFCKQDFYEMWGQERSLMTKFVTVSTLGLMVFASLAVVLWAVAVDTFKAKCGRIFERPSPWFPNRSLGTRPLGDARRRAGEPIDSQ